MADGCFREDFPCDIERELCSEWDRVIVGRRRERQLVGRMGGRFV